MSRVSARPIFIVGCERSGTSALWRALSLHSGLRQRGPEDDGRPQETMKELWFAQEFFRGREVNERRPHAGSDIDRDYVQRYADFLHQFCRETYAPESGRWIAAHPKDAFFLDELLELFPQGRALFLLRHPQETVWSYQHAPWSKRGSRRSFLRRTVRVADRWRRFAERWLEVSSSGYRDRVLLVRHERLLSEPAVVAREALEHVGESEEAAVTESLGSVFNSSFLETGKPAADMSASRDAVAGDRVFCRRVVAVVGDLMARFDHRDLGGGVDDLAAYCGRQKRLRKALDALRVGRHRRPEDAR